MHCSGCLSKAGGVQTQLKQGALPIPKHPLPQPLGQEHTSVPWRARAALPSCRIFSRYIWAARLLYLVLVSLAVHPCWRKKAVWKAKKKKGTGDSPRANEVHNHPRKPPNCSHHRRKCFNTCRFSLNASHSLQLKPSPQQSMSTLAQFIQAHRPPGHRGPPLSWFVSQELLNS